MGNCLHLWEKKKLGKVWISGPPPSGAPFVLVSRGRKVQGHCGSSNAELKPKSPLQRPRLSRRAEVLLVPASPLTPWQGLSQPLWLPLQSTRAHCRWFWTHPARSHWPRAEPAGLSPGPLTDGSLQSPLKCRILNANGRPAWRKPVVTVGR